MKRLNLQKIKDQKGFTIVELLIVIVIIGVLASIVVVAYNGITSRAKDSSDKTVASQIAKVAQAYQADNGSYPISNNTLSSTTSASLPAGVNLTQVTTAPTFTTTAAFTSWADNTVNTGKTFSVKYCSTSTTSPNNIGLMIYYPNRSTSLPEAITVGTGC